MDKLELKIHRFVKSPKAYAQISDEDLSSFIKQGFKVISTSRKLRVLGN